MPSAVVAAGSCHLTLTPPIRRVALRTRLILRWSSSSVFWPNHWNGVCGLGTKPPRLTVTDGTVGVFLADRHAVLRQLGDAERVLVGLGRQTGEEVQLHPGPALAERRIDGTVEILFGDQLVDHLAQSPRATLGGERETAAATVVDFARQTHGECIDTQRRQVDGQRVAGAGNFFGVLENAAHDRLDIGEVGGRQRRQADFVVARGTQSPHGSWCGPVRRVVRGPGG